MKHFANNWGNRFLSPAGRPAGDFFQQPFFSHLLSLALPPLLSTTTLSLALLCVISLSLVAFHNLSSVSFPRNSPNFICFIYPPSQLSIFFLKVQSSFSFEPCLSPIYFLSPLHHSHLSRTLPQSNKLENLESSVGIVHLGFNGLCYCNVISNPQILSCLCNRCT